MADSSATVTPAVVPVGGGRDATVRGPEPAPPGPRLAFRLSRPAPRPRRRSAAALAAVPPLAFTGLCFGVPAPATLNGAFTAQDPTTGASHYTTANLSASLHGAYLTALAGSVKVANVAAVSARRQGRPFARRAGSQGLLRVRQLRGKSDRVLPKTQATCPNKMSQVRRNAMTFQ